MKIRSKIAGADDWLFLEEIPDSYSAETALSEKQIIIKQSSIQKLCYNQISGGGLFLMHANMQFNEPVRIVSEVEEETIVSHFVFYNTAKQSLKTEELTDNSKHDISYIPSLNGMYEMIPGISYNYFLMVLSKEYYLRLIDEHSLLTANCYKQIDPARFALLAQDLSFTIEMQEVISDIYISKETGQSKRLFTESKVLKLLLFLLEEIQLNGKTNKLAIRHEELDKLHLAKEILDSRYINPPTLKELSKLILLNDFKLKRGFKACFGTTVYGYITRLRMERARHLILTEHKNIGEVAHAIGFKYQAHLTNAFKKYFGILPSNIKA